MRILIAGSGIAGLGAALALTGPGRTVEVLERDPGPPEGNMDAVFAGWDRKGVPHLRHSHVFLARLFNLIRDRYPALHERLLEAGARELTFNEALWPSARETYTPEPADRNLSFLSSRRTTLESAMRVYTEEKSGAVFHAGHKVRGILADTAPDGRLAMTGLKVETPDGKLHLWNADLIIDATGRSTPFPDWLGGYGAAPRAEEAPSGILYYSRHYRLNPGLFEPGGEAGGAARGGDFGFIKGGVFPADGGNFSITLALPETERELRRVVLHPDVFDACAQLLPGLGAWIDPDRAAPTSKVYSMGNLKSLWRHWIEQDEPLVLHFFAIGDATIRTNPLYGRGCSIGQIQAHILADVLRATDDPVARAKFFAERVWTEIRPFYDLMVRQDAGAVRRAIKEHDPDFKPHLRALATKRFMRDAITPAMRGDAEVLRALMRSFHMLDEPNAWLKDPRIVARILKMWMTPMHFKKHLYSDQAAPNRSDVLALAEAHMKPKRQTA